MVDVFVNGIPASKHHMTYAPDNSNLYQYAPTSFKALEQSFEARRGGIYYGGTLGIKVISLRFVVAPDLCSETLHTLRDGYFRLMQDYFRLGKESILNFSDLSFIKYKVVFTSIKPVSYMYNGFVVDVEAKCYDGVGYSDISTSSDSIVRNNSNILPASFVISDSAATYTSNFYYNIYNPGTQKTGAVITIGSGSSWSSVLSIYNSTTGEILHLNASPTALTSDMVIDCNKHTITFNNPLAERFPLLRHRDGWINLTPGNKEIISGTVSGTTFTTEEAVYDFGTDDTYIACKAGSSNAQPVLTNISAVSNYNVLTFDKNIEPEVEGKLEIVRRNHLYISSTGSFTLNNFNISCTPRFE